MQITDLKQGIKNPERVNVYVDGKYTFSLDVSQVVDYKLKIGKKISEQELIEYKKASEFGKLYQRALEWTLMRPHSEREVKDYLQRKLTNILRGHPRNNRSEEDKAPTMTTAEREHIREEYSEFSRRIVERLRERGYINDENFAKWYAENRFVKKGISQKRLKMELIKKGVSKDIIENVLSARDDEEEIRKILKKKQSKYDDPTKLIAYLCRQGFSYDLVKKIVSENE